MDHQKITDFIEADRKDTSGSSWVSIARKYFFIGLGKTASTRIKLSLHQLEGHPVLENDYFPWLHERSKAGAGFVSKLSDFDEAAAAEILTSPDWFRFSFTRNPYDRLFAAYKMFIMQEVAPPSPYYNQIKIEIRAMFDYAGRSGLPDTTVNFRDFVRYVEETVGQRPDYHWSPMTSGLRPDLVKYDFIGRFEHFNEDFALVLRRLKTDEALIPGLLEPVNQSNLKRQPLAAVYDWDLADQVYELYQADFENFGYEKNSWLL